MDKRVNGGKASAAGASKGGSGLEFSSKDINRKSSVEFFKRVSKREEQRAKKRDELEARRGHARAKRAMRRAKAENAKKDYVENSKLGSTGYYLFYGWHKAVTILVVLVVVSAAIGIPLWNHHREMVAIQKVQEQIEKQEENERIDALPAVKAQKISAEADKKYRIGDYEAARKLFQDEIDAAHNDGDLQYELALLDTLARTEKNTLNDFGYVINIANRAYALEPSPQRASLIADIYSEAGLKDKAEEYRQKYNELLGEQGDDAFTGSN